MQIIVEKFDETIFEGDADDFLFDNNSDTDLEMALNDLEGMKIGSNIQAYDDNGDLVTITKTTLYVDQDLTFDFEYDIVLLENNKGGINNGNDNYKY